MICLQMLKWSTTLKMECFIVICHCMTCPIIMILGITLVPLAMSVGHHSCLCILISAGVCHCTVCGDTLLSTVMF